MHFKSFVFYIIFSYQIHHVKPHTISFGQNGKNELVINQFSGSDQIRENPRIMRSVNDTSSGHGLETGATPQKSVKKDLPKQSDVIAPLPISNISQTEIKPKPLSTVSANNTTSVEDTSQLKPGTVKRGIIVFGSLTFLFIGYMAYKIWRKSVDSSKDNYLSETQLFKYGVLKSDDNPENMELARMPLTVDSEDDDDDDDLEIFDLEHNRRFQNTREVYNNSNVGKSDIQILDLELPDQNTNSDKGFVLLDLNNDSTLSSTSKDKINFT